MSKLFHGNSKKEQANPKKWNNKQKPTVSATHLELSRCQPDMDFSQALRLDELCKGYKKEVHLASWSWMAGESSTQGRGLGWRHPFWWGGSNHTARVWQVFWGMFTEILCIGLGWCHIMTPNYWGLMEFHQTYLMFQLVQKVRGCREFGIKNVRLMHRMIFDNKNETCFLPWDFVQDFFRICWVDKWSFDQDDEMHICVTWWLSSCVCIIIHFFKCFNKKRRLQWDGLITA